MTKEISPKKQLPTPTDDVGSYLNKINQIPVLTREEEKSLAKALYKDHDIDAARILVMHHLRFLPCTGLSRKLTNLLSRIGKW